MSEYVQQYDSRHPYWCSTVVKKVDNNGMSGYVQQYDFDIRRSKVGLRGAFRRKPLGEYGWARHHNVQVTG